jgi:anti-anti-sigma factor
MPAEAAPVSLTVKTDCNGDCTTFLLTGKLVAGMGDFLYKKVSAATPNSKRIILDLSAVDHLDSMGLGTLVRLYVHCKSAGCTLQLIHLGKRVRELLGMTNLLGIFADIGEKGITHF